MARSRFVLPVTVACLLLSVACERHKAQPTAAGEKGAKSVVPVHISDKSGGGCQTDQPRAPVRKTDQKIQWTPIPNTNTYYIHFRVSTDNPPGPGSPLQGGANDFQVPSGQYPIDRSATVGNYYPYDVLNAQKNVCDPYNDPGVIVK